MDTYKLEETSGYSNCFPDSKCLLDDYGGTTKSGRGKIFANQSPYPSDYENYNIESHQLFQVDVDQVKTKQKGENKSPPVKNPGETKNMAKCYARMMNNYRNDIIKNTTDESLKEILEKEEQFQKFKELKPDLVGKKKLEELIDTEAGQLLASDFFGNCRWIYGLVKENKANIEPYLRHNFSYFNEAQRCKKRKCN